MEENRKNLEIVAGNGSNLNISPVYEHINTSRPKSSDKRPTNIIVPSSIKEDNSSNDNIEKQHEEDSNVETIDDVTFDIIEEEAIEISDNDDNDDDENIENEDLDLFFVNEDDEIEVEIENEDDDENESIVKAKDKDKELYIKDSKNNVEFNSIFFDEDLITIEDTDNDSAEEEDDDDDDQNKKDNDND